MRTLYVPGRGLYPPPRCGVPRAAAWRPTAGSSPIPRTWTRPAGSVEENYQSITLTGSLVARTGSWTHAAALPPAAGSSPTPRTSTRPAGSEGDV